MMSGNASHSCIFEDYYFRSLLLFLSYTACIVNLAVTTVIHVFEPEYYRCDGRASEFDRSSIDGLEAIKLISARRGCPHHNQMLDGLPESSGTISIAISVSPSVQLGSVHGGDNIFFEAGFEFVVISCRTQDSVLFPRSVIHSFISSLRSIALSCHPER